MSTSLIVFIIVVTLSAIALIFDAALKWLLGFPTISEDVWARPALGVILVSVWAIGGIALAIHLFCGK